MFIGGLRIEMTVQEQNQKIFSTKHSVGDKKHCGCENCLFYAEKIVKNIKLVKFLQSFGVDVQKADEVWCYKEENGYKYFSVDYVNLYSEMEGTYTFDNVIVKIDFMLEVAEGQPTHWIEIEAILEVE